MKLKYFFAKLHGYVRMKLSTDADLMCKHDFWFVHRFKDEWEREIDTVWVEPIEDGRVQCIITLKAA